MEPRVPRHRRAGALLPRPHHLQGEHDPLSLKSPLPDCLHPRHPCCAHEVSYSVANKKTALENQLDQCSIYCTIAVSYRGYTLFYDKSTNQFRFLPQDILFLQCGGQPGHHNHDVDRALLSIFLQRIQTCGSHGDYGLQNAGPGHCQVRKQFELQNFTCTDNKQIIFLTSGSVPSSLYS